MKLRERMESIKGNPMICLGAQASFLMIAPKDEMQLWLQENETRVKVFNGVLQRDKRKKKRLSEKQKSAFLDREIKSETWNDYPHHGLIILIEGDEYGLYSTRGDITGEDWSKDVHVTSEFGAERLVDSILAEFAKDITEFELFEVLYHHGKLNTAGERKYEDLKRPNDIAVEFFTSDALGIWTDIDGEWIIQKSKEAIWNRIKNIKRRVCRLRAWDARLEGLYSITKKDQIVDMIIDGASPTDIIEAVGKGKGNLATPEMFRDVSKKFTEQMKEETRKYLTKGACLELDKPLKEQMKVDNKKLEQAWKDRLERAKNKRKEK